MQVLNALLITAALLIGIALGGVWLYRSTTRTLTKSERAEARKIAADAIARAKNPPGSFDA